MFDSPIQFAGLRCKKCRHLVNLHKERIIGKDRDNGYCKAKSCLCDMDKIQLLEMLKK